MAKVGNWFKSFFSKIGDGFAAIGKSIKKAWIFRNEPVKPGVAWAIILVEVAIVAALAYYFWF